MNWNKSFFVVMLVGMTVFAMVGCGKTEEPAVPMEQPTFTPAGTRTAPTIEPSPSNPQDATRPVSPTGSPPAGLTPTGLPPGGMPSVSPTAMDLAKAAAKLGVTEQQLRDALGDVEQKPLDLAAAAKKLGISEETLREALGFPAGGPPAGTPSDNASPPRPAGQK